MPDLLEVPDGRLARGHRTRELLLTAALKLFGERGFHATTMKELANEAGVSPPAVYNHFDSKESVLFAALTWGLERFRRVVVDVDDCELDPLDRLESIVKRHIRYQVRYAGRARFADRLLDSVAAGELLSQPRRRQITRMRSVYQDLIDELVSESVRDTREKLPPVGVCRAAILNMCDRAPQWGGVETPMVAAAGVEEDIWFLVQGMLGVDRFREGQRRSQDGSARSSPSPDRVYRARIRKATPVRSA